MLDDLEWNGELGFGVSLLFVLRFPSILSRADTMGTLRQNETAVDDWYVNGKKAGTWTSARNMTYVKILEASHMVSYNSLASDLGTPR